MWPWPLILFLSITVAQARETDNYSVWGKELTDSAGKINEYLRQEIEVALAKAPRGLDCAQITLKVADRFKTGFRYESRFEKWTRQNLTAEQIFPFRRQIIKESIYRDPFFFYMKYFEPAPTLQINGYYLGTDKLSHFGSIGRSYLRHYLQAIKRGMNEVEAVEKAIDSGLLLERTYLGYLGSGVFSYADLEANYQGFLFLRRMCLSSEESYLRLTSEGEWVLSEAPDIKDYVDGHWDESYNRSHLLKANWRKVSPFIKEYCAQSLTPEVLARMNYYRATSGESQSVRYLAELRRSDPAKAPDPAIDQSWATLCSE